jgi:GT2 family glycosyltransferase
MLSVISRFGSFQLADAAIFGVCSNDEDSSTQNDGLTTAMISPLISVLVHNYNRACVLAKCFASLTVQTYRPLEVVVLDAGSTDSSWQVIQEWAESMRQRGIEVKIVQCSLMGVSASRNLAAAHASGSLLCVIDNDATLVESAALERLVNIFQSHEDVASVSFRVLLGDTDAIDTSAWVFRRNAAKWSDRKFYTFTFTGGAFCIRAAAFRDLKGFWEDLQFSREEEDFGLALIDRGWEMLYSPLVTVRHHCDTRDRSSLADRRFVELRNGLLVLWRRLPLPLALLACAARVTTVSVRTVRERHNIIAILRAVPAAFSEWRRYQVPRVPIGFGSTLKYLRLHVSELDGR